MYYWIYDDKKKDKLNIADADFQKGGKLMTEKIIARGRGTGKTSELIRESARTGKYILVANRSHGEALCNIAKKLGVNIPYPVTVDELKRLDAYISKSSIVRDGILVDEAIMVLEALSGIKIKGATITVDDQNQPPFKVGEYYSYNTMDNVLHKSY